jgi:hypothetical protein
VQLLLTVYIYACRNEASRPLRQKMKQRSTMFTTIGCVIECLSAWPLCRPTFDGSRSVFRVSHELLSRDESFIGHGNSWAGVQAEQLPICRRVQQTVAKQSARPMHHLGPQARRSKPRQAPRDLQRGDQLGGRCATISADARPSRPTHGHLGPHKRSDASHAKLLALTSH